MCWNIDEYYSLKGERERERESSGCEKRRRRTCITGEEAENGLQRTVRQSSRSEIVKNTE
jgi:hypothetical protein